MTGDLVERPLCKGVRHLLRVNVLIEVRSPVACLPFTEHEIRGRRQRVLDTLHRLGAHAGQDVGSPVAPQQGGERHSLRLSSRQGRERLHTQTALDDGTPKQPLAQRRDQVRAHAHAARGFAEDGDVPRISTERRDVRLYPFERGDLVLDTIVA